MGVGATYAIVSRLSADLPDVAGLATYEAPQTSRVFSRDGKVIATMFVENRTTVPLDRMSPYLVKALVAVEDSRFFQHGGVDWWGAGRALVANVFFHGIDQGASTLTMQLARNRFLSQDRTYARKIREIIMARRIEKKFSKEKILEYYLNNVYFGSGTYGVAAASSLYFGKAPSQLTIAEAALIAGLVQAPSYYSPLVDPKAAIKRMKIVLGRMRDTGILNDKQFKLAVSEGEGFKFRAHGPAAAGGANSDQLLKYPWFTTFVIGQLGQRFPEDMLYRGGLQVRTTLDTDLQALCEDELSATMAADGPGQNAHEAALVLIENRTGAIRAMVGGTRWSQNNQFNRAWQAERQPGSSFKAFVYTAALLHGLTPESIVDDSPGSIGGWTPKNSDGLYKGKIPLRQALQESRNPVAARLCELVGPERVVQVAHSLGITEALEPHLALALGACEVSPLSMASAYSTLASGGVFHAPECVAQVGSADGGSLVDNRNIASKQVLPSDVAAQMTEMLLRAVQYGTGTAAYIDGVDVAGKTGTTDDTRDAWFVGFTPDYTLAVWVGNDDHSAMYSVYGGGLPAQLWRRTMARVVQHGLEHARFEFPDRAVSVRVCVSTGFLAGPNCPKVRTMQFASGQVPTQVCPTHGQSATPSATPEPTETPDDEPPETVPLATETVAPPPEPVGTPVPEEAPTEALPAPDNTETAEPEPPEE